MSAVLVLPAARVVAILNEPKLVIVPEPVTVTSQCDRWVIHIKVKCVITSLICYRDT